MKENNALEKAEERARESETVEEAIAIMSMAFDQTEAPPACDLIMSPSIDKIMPAFIKAQLGFKAVKKTGSAKKSKNSSEMRSYATLDDVLLAITPALNKEDLIITQPVRFDQGNLTVSTILMHSSGQWLSTHPMHIKVTDSAFIQGIQSIGSYITYTRRYQLSPFAGVASEIDDDGQAATETQTQPQNQNQNQNQKKNTTPPKERTAHQNKDKDKPGSSTQPQIGGVQGRYKALGYELREEIKADIEKQIGRTVNSSNELSWNEASKIIEYLEDRKTKGLTYVKTTPAPQETTEPENQDTGVGESETMPENVTEEPIEDAGTGEATADTISLIAQVAKKVGIKDKKGIIEKIRKVLDNDVIQGYTDINEEEATQVLGILLAESKAL